MQSQPLAKADFQQLLEDWVDRQGAGFAERLQTGAAYYLRNPMAALPENVKAPVHPLKVLSAVSDPNGMATITGLENNLFALLGPAIKQGLKPIVDEMDFADAGPPRIERVKMIEALDAKIVELDSREKELVEAAEAAGIRL